MSISERQYTKILSEELLKYLLEGKVPNSNEIASNIQKALPSNGNITYQYFEQPSKDIFQIEQYNNSLKQIKFDIDTFQEELLDLFAESIKRINYADLYHKVHSYELNNLQSILETILFSLDNADYYFLGVFDNFTDTSKINFKESTSEVLNIAENVLNLPYGARATKRISTSHLMKYSTWGIEVLTPDSSQLYKKENLAGTNFGAMFSDSLQAWGYQIMSKENVPVSIQFVVPLAGAAEEEIEVFVNRFEILSHSIGPQKIKVEVSTDNINFTTPLGYEDGVNLIDSKKIYAMDFETNLVQYIRITLTKNSADVITTLSAANISADAGVETNREVYQYQFGLKSISAYTVGRTLQATYVSKPYTFKDVESISKIAIKSDYIKPAGTNLSYSIALTNSSGELITDYLPINPLGKQLKASAPNTLTFDNSYKKSKRFSIPTTKTVNDLKYGNSFRGRYLYKLDSLDPAPTFGSIELTRGYNSWARDTSLIYNDVTVPDCYVNFSNTDNESLYTLLTESCRFQKTSSGSLSYPIGYPPNATNIFTQPTQRQVTVTLSKYPYFDATKGHLLRPTYSTNANTTTSPNYAIHKVRHIQATRRTTVSFGIVDLYVARPARELILNLPVTNFVLNTADIGSLPELSVIPATPNPRPEKLLLGIDYEIETTTVDGIQVPTGRIKILEAANKNTILVGVGGPPIVGYLTPILGFEFKFTPQTDITHKVSSLANNQIILNNCYIEDSDIIEVTYRYLVTPPNEIVKASIQVYNSPSTNQTRIKYREGVDYLVNARTNSIRRIESGSISSTSGVHVEYKFRNAEVAMEVFSTWCRIDDPAGTQVKFDLDTSLKQNKLIADDTKGEAFYVSGPFGLIDITKAAGTPVMPPGWVQFIVKSKSPTVNNNYQTNLIDQVIQLRNINRQKVFVEGNIYFSAILAYREPLVQRTLNHLKVNTLATDNQSFAIDDITDDTSPSIVVNFLPNSTKDLYNYAPTSSDALDTRPVKVAETFSVAWSYPNEESIVKSNNLVVRIDLDRDVTTDGALTPKVLNYHVRVGL